MKKLAILGGGESGTGAAILAQQKGYEVYLSDHGRIKEPYRTTLLEKGIALEEGNHNLGQILTADEVVKSPGISHQIPIIKSIEAAGIPIIDEIELAARYTEAFLIGITGSNVKSTTTYLTYHLLKQAGFKVAMAGNIGESFARKVASGNYDYYVLELSSFQLETIQAAKRQGPGLRLNIACLLNITPDHLDRYNHDMEPYIAAKISIVHHLTQDGICIYNADDTLLSSQLLASNMPLQGYPITIQEKQSTGAYLESETKTVWLRDSRQGDNVIRLPLTEMPLSGQHNYYNAMAAIAISTALSVSPDRILSGLKTFQALPHRLAWVATINGIDFYNDSKATNVSSALVALQSFSRPIIWLAGGYDKGNDYTPLLTLVQQKVKAIILLGKDNTRIKEAFAKTDIPIQETHAIRTAIEWVLRLGKPNDIALLSPACASTDLFRNFEDRGEQFTNNVKAMAK